MSTTPAERYRVEIYRIGGYGGQGGARVACLPAPCGGVTQGTSRTVPEPNAKTGEVRAGWPVTDALRVTGWKSGFYVAKLVLASGPSRGRSAGVPFVVRASAGDRSAVLVVAPVNTWQAYNAWGGRSLYSSPRSATVVSFDRPYAVADPQPGLGYPVARFIDQFGYDAAYTTDVDVDRQPAELARHRLVVVPGHSEYWTKPMRDGFERARARGVSLAFLGGNTAYWQIRYASPARRALVEYRSASADPYPGARRKTVRWRAAPLDRPECALVGVQWQGGFSSTEVHDYGVVADALGDAWFRHTGFRKGDKVVGAVGYEWDSVAPECDGKLPPLTVFFHYEGRSTDYGQGVFRTTFHSTDANAVRYRAPSGATVCAAGSIDFGWALTGSADGSPVADGVTSEKTPPDPRLQRFMRNAFSEMIGAA